MESFRAANIAERNFNSAQEELYQLLAHPEGSTRPFCMMVRLTQEILEELKHAEAEDIMPRMKFGNDVGGHVIEVGLETFEFSSATEPGNVCYIYTEKSDENGNHILREVGSTCHDFSILSLREKELHKAEAENKQKAQKSPPDYQNPHLRTPQDSLMEVNALVGMVQEPPLKKRKVTKCPVPLAHAQIGNQYISTSASLLPELMGAAVKDTPETPSMALPLWKDKPTNAEELLQPLCTDRCTEKEQPLCTDRSKLNITDVRNLLISLLQEMPKGMTIKALEKAVTEKLAVNPERKWIERIIKSIATFQAPGKYILKPGIEKGSFANVSIGSTGKSNETFCVETVETKPLTDSLLEAVSQKELNPDLSKASYIRSPDSPVNKHFSPRPVQPHIKSPDSPTSKHPSPKPVQPHIANGFAGKSPRNGAMDTTSIGGSGSDPRNGAMDAESIGGSGSDPSSTSGSESESGTSSKEIATITSESSSGSESDASTSSSEPNMDEDVDIMSDGEDKMRFDPYHLKLNGKELELLVTQDSELQEKTEEVDSVTVEKHNANLEIQPRSPGRISPPLGEVKVEERECMTDSLIGTIFSPADSDAVEAVDNGVLLKADNLMNSISSSTLRIEATCGVPLVSQMPSNMEIDTFSKTPESYQERGHGKQEQRKRAGSDRSASLGQMEATAGKRVKHLDNLVDKICKDKNAGSTSSWLDAHQTYYQSPSFKESEMLEKREPEYLLTKKETRIPLEKADGNFHIKVDNLSSKNSSLSFEVSKENLVGSSLKEKDRLQRVGRSSVNKLQSKQQSSVEPNQRKKPGKADKPDASRARSSQCKERVAPKMVSINSRAGQNRKFARSLHSSSKELQGKNDCSRFKEDSSMPKLTDLGETLTRRGKSLKAQTCPKKDSGRSKTTTASSNKELGDLHHAMELGRINKDTQKGSLCNSLELLERTGSFEQAERSKNGSEQGPKSKIDGLNETGPKERSLNDGILSSSASKERTMETAKLDSGQSSHSGHAFSRSPFHESQRHDSKVLEPGEFREPVSENELCESKRLSLKREKHCFEEATSRVASDSMSMTPDHQKPLLLCRSKPEAFPAQGEGNFSQDLDSQEITAQDTRRTASFQALKMNQGAQQSKQKLAVKQSQQRERSASINKGLGGSTRSGGSNSQNPTAGSKETSRKHCNKLSENLNPTAFSQQKASNAICTPKMKSLREDHRVKELQISYTKQAPWSSEVYGGEFFSPYEKEKPELRGTIYSFEQFKDYYKEFNEKYPIYTQLNSSLEHDKENFEMFRKDFEEAQRRGDMAKLAIIHGIVKKEYLQCRKRSKRMRHTFKVLHEELQVIKQQCKNFVQNTRRQ